MIHRWMFAVTVCTLWAGSGCDSNDRGGQPASSAQPTPAKRSGPLWKISETEQPITTALAIGARDQKAWMFRISTASQRCPTASTEFPGPACPDKSNCLELWYAPSVKADSGSPWEYVNAYVARGGNRRGGRVTAELFDTVEEGEATVVLRKLDIRLTDHEEISFEGDIEATKCPRLPRPAKPFDEPPKLDLKVAGTELDIRGALVIHRDGHPILRLATAPIACPAPSREGLDVLVDFALTDDGSSLRFASLGGARVRGDPVSSQAKDGIRVTAKGELTGEGSTTFELEGKHDIQGHTVDVSGTVVATRCVPVKLPAQ